MEEVRCFAERQQFKIRPLTFLVGENSTGKTTALACFQVLANYLKSGEVDFNAEPYSMGIFKDIVRNSRPKGSAFKLGFTFTGERENVEYTVECVQKKDGFEPAIESVTIKFTDGKIIFQKKDTSDRGINLPSFDETRNQYARNQYYVDVESIFFDNASLSLLLNYCHSIRQSEGKHPLAEYIKKKYENIGDIGGMHDISVFSASPVRSRPKRTYDPTREFNDPEGSDVPMRLMRIESTKKDEWEVLKQALVEFGKSSGLFQNIEIQTLGGSLGAPFQLKIKVRGPNSNIIDVGYGVSQILPILVHILSPSLSQWQKTFFLLQQPEVHLHPKAQAQLSSLFAMSANGDQSFIVETHSDYMIDRARIEIRKGTIDPEDVSLIYLEPKRRFVKVHNIGFDKMGNMIGVPAHYGKFFMKETASLMGFED
jgi:predicted ATPase